MRTGNLYALAVSGALVCILPSISVAADWVDGRGQRCDLACEAQGSSAVSSGSYTNGEDYFICAAHLPDGDRPGYNVAPSWSNSCYVGIGGKEHGANQFSCLCE